MFYCEKLNSVWLHLLTYILLITILFIALPSQAFDVRSVAFTSWGTDSFGSEEAKRAVDWAKCLGASDVAFVTENYFDPRSDSIIDRHELSGPNGALLKLVHYAKARGLRVMIKPHYLNVQTGNNLAFPVYRPRRPDRFFASLSENIQRHAAIAAASQADRLVIATEMGGQITGYAYHDHWTTLIRTVRRIFSGNLTYAATVSTDWPDSESANEAAFVSFWPQLDEAGFDIYPTLTTQPDTSTGELIALHYRNDRGQNTVEHVRELVERVGIPVLFTELGIRSMAGTLGASGDWELKGGADQRIQANALEAAMTVWSREGVGWLLGINLWEIRINDYPGAGDTGYDFRGKLAEKVVGSWFGAGESKQNPRCDEPNR